MVKKILIGSSLLAISIAIAGVSAGSVSQEKSNSNATDNYVQERTKQQQSRYRALASRGKAVHYEQLLGSMSRASFGFPASPQNQSLGDRQLQAKYEKFTEKETAIDLAALSFTASDVAAYRKHNVDLVSIVHRLLMASATPEENLIVADNVLVAKAMPSDSSQTRVDGYRSALVFEVEESLKGRLLEGDIVRIPRRSGKNSDGSIVAVSHDIHSVPGKRYLLVLSKDWYEQKVIEAGKEPEIGFNAAPLLVYDISEGGAIDLQSRSIFPMKGAALRDIQAVKTALKNAAMANN